MSEWGSDGGRGIFAWITKTGEGQKAYERMEKWESMGIFGE